MEWMSFKDKLPQKIHSFIIWEDDRKTGHQLGIAWLTEEDYCDRPCPDHGFKCPHRFQELSREVIYNYASDETIRLDIKEVLKRNFYWMEIPEGPINEALKEI